ncbi:MAG: dephospho-CoA kinase [Chloroflexi bacterium]|nr:dephospho-CoA kinase [Chloroflexota bacterium]
MVVIGLTGGIGSGKSTVASILAGMGATVIDADKVGHEVYCPGGPAWQDVVTAFGKGILNDTNEIDRQKLAKIVFGNPEALAKLNAILHPRMYRMVEERIKKARQRGDKVVVLEAALLIEAGWRLLVDEVWVMVAPVEKVVRRLKDKKGVAEEDARARIRVQLAAEELQKHADVVIKNNGSLEELKEKVGHQWQVLSERKGNDC